MATEEKEAVKKPEFPVPAGMFIIGYAVRNGERYAVRNGKRHKQPNKGTRLYQRYHDAVNAANGTRSNHYLTGGTVAPVYAMKESK